MHGDELHVDVGTARRLIGEQFPRWSGLGVRRVRTAGTVNAVFRVGDALVARFPFRAEEPASVLDLLTREQAAAREFAEVSSVRSPRPLAIGKPGHGYPLPWSVQTWVPGADAVTEEPAG